MIYTTCIMLYAIFSHGQDTPRRVLIASVATAAAIFTTLYYHYIKDPLFHQNMFAFLTIVVFFRSLYVMEVTLRPSKRAQVNGYHKTSGVNEQKRLDQRDLSILKNMYQLIPIGLGSVGIGFLIWNLDNIYCTSLRSWRRQIGLPWGVLLEGHGWW